MDWKEAIAELRDEIKSHAKAIVQKARDSDLSDANLQTFVESELQDVCSLQLFLYACILRKEL